MKIERKRGNLPVKQVTQGFSLTFSLLEVSSLEVLADALIAAKSLRDKLEVLQALPQIEMSDEGFSLEEQVVLREIMACGKGELLEKKECLPLLLKDLLPVDRFFRDLGGLVGYQAMMLKLLHPEEEKSEVISFRSPAWWDLTKDAVEAERAVTAGIEYLPMMAEIYPLGGAGDRLALVDKKSGEALPAATLRFGGKTLLQGLIEDLQAREYLYFKQTGNVCLTPVAIMTSEEKNNHQRILDIFEEQMWFGRPRESFRFFKQPLVPSMDARGGWCFREDGRLLLKPGGHGVIWKLAEESGVFEWFKARGRTKALVRQVNNPVAGCDGGLLALTGIGCREKKDFGVASCPRVVGSHEGMVVLKEKKRETGFEHCQSNVEYCEFQKLGIVDTPEKKGSRYSRYPSNTNILFVDLEAVRKALALAPIPGMLVNKKRSVYFDAQGIRCEGEVARLESTMQNIADHMGEVSPRSLIMEEAKGLRTFLTYNERKKTISCTKKKYTLGASLLETPEGAFLDVLENAYDLLVNHCGMDVPKVRTPAAFFAKGPSFLFSYHPALGPRYADIAKRVRGGRLAEGSALDVQIAEFEAEDLCVDGSVTVRAEDPIGGGRCSLKNVRFINRGIDRMASNCYWQGTVQMHERFEIVIEGSGEFIAEDVTFHGAMCIVVKDGVRLVVKEVEGQLTFLESARE